VIINRAEMGRLVFTLILVTFLTDCQKTYNSANPPSVTDYLINKTWRTYDYKLNGAEDTTELARQQILVFTKQGTIYFSKKNPVFLDTLNYIVLDDSTIELNKPSFSLQLLEDFRIGVLNANEFDFKTRSTLSNNREEFKTRPE
jgi:hypothetical protein